MHCSIVAETSRSRFAHEFIATWWYIFSLLLCVALVVCAFGCDSCRPFFFCFINWIFMQNSERKFHVCTRTKRPMKTIYYESTQMRRQQKNVKHVCRRQIDIWLSVRFILKFIDLSDSKHQQRISLWASRISHRFVSVVATCKWNCLLARIRVHKGLCV